METTSMLDRFRGCLLGHAVGDAMGAPFEGMPGDLIYRMFGLYCDFIAHPTVEQLVYTDDTQMMIGVAEALLENGEIRFDSICEAFVRNYEPDRGYGSGARKILAAMAEGQDSKSIAEKIFPGGSYGNGAAMRVSPVGLLFNNNKKKLIEQACLSAIPTHLHPLGIEGAVLISAAIAYCINTSDLNKNSFYDYLQEFAHEDEYKWQLSVAAELSRDDILSTLGSSLEAHRSVVTAIACFVAERDSYANTIGRAISLGDDTDTVAAMAGAISGAYLGFQAIPENLIDIFEKSKKGIDYINQLGFNSKKVGGFKRNMPA